LSIFTKFSLAGVSLAASILISGHASAGIIVDQLQANKPVYMAGFSQTDLAQSFEQDGGNIAGAGIYLQDGIGFGDATISIDLWTDLPNAGGTKIIGGTASTSTNDHWLDVFWTPIAITPHARYVLVFDSTNSRYGVAGDTGNPYALGQTYANGGYASFPGFDYTFRTYASDGLGASAAPEPSAWALMILGFGGVGGLVRRRRQTAIA
jgi:hypothetical protein